MTTYRVEMLPPDFAARIRVNPVTGCWEWQHGGLGDAPDHYGQVQWDGEIQAVHRCVYKMLVGPIPDGLVLDHVYDWGCRARSCCWPGHLDPVTHSENGRRRFNADAKRRRVQLAGEPDDLLLMPDIKRLTGWSATTLLQLRGGHGGPPMRLAGRRVVARRGDLMEWVASYDRKHSVPARERKAADAASRQPDPVA